MNENLYEMELRLEEEARSLSAQRFLKDHLKGLDGDTYAETFVGTKLLKNYLIPYSRAIEDWIHQANQGGVGRRMRAAQLLADIDPMMISYLMLKSIINLVPSNFGDQPCSIMRLALHGAGLIHTELRLRHFDQEYGKLSKRIHEDFNQRELPRYKREEYMRKMFSKVDLDWSIWTKNEMALIGFALIDRFKEVTGDLQVVSVRRGKKTHYAVTPSDALVKIINDMTENHADLFTSAFPMIVSPIDWGPDNLETGGYVSHHISPYKFVKGAKRGYLNQLKLEAENGVLDHVLHGVNALQKTRWAVNVPVLDVMEQVYRLNLECGKLPKADPIPLPEWPSHLPNFEDCSPDEQEEFIKAKSERFIIHEQNRRMIGKRVVAQRAFSLARKMASYPAIYFPHDLDSRGRAYPVPSGLNPQGPDYVKALLQFAEGKVLGENGVRWLAIHGANCWGEDKLPLHERERWGHAHYELARSVARDPIGTFAEWGNCDNPAQFLAWCLAWAEAHEGKPEEYICRLHVDVDATCSGLQHFSAMLRDEVGGYHVNMTPNDERQDVYGAVASAAVELIEKDLGGDNDALAKAWLKFGVDRKITKRPVMVKPYAGTRQSCITYVSDAVTDRLKAGEPIPWPEDDLFTFQLYGANKVWEAIPKVVVAADGAMRWLSSIARLVGKSQPDCRRIEWRTPAGLPVHQYKFNHKVRRLKTFFDGSVIRPRLLDETDKLDPRQMASSVAPSFVHSLDACHLQMTVARAVEEGITDFAAVHDSFGVHPSDVDKFSRIIRETFVEMYTEHDVLQEFLEDAKRLISPEFHKDIPPIPPKGQLDLQGILENEFFFS
ncbi:DNA-directed RNA polymerase [Maritalea mediterranea]|uniref:DNA-directed RNA polymerase n=1 Tax=Maritalea mediterranea TaxID=2909667 RepID=A0ABS9EAE0_9HYPH|nr:DNA-directed RNA polymerase [Maritalea mediterranea]MCF4099812.1 hypothetical protein [Maritalea mediterranea]